MTPHKALQSGRPEKAIKLGLAKIKEGKDVERSRQVIELAAAQIREEVREEYPVVLKSDVSKWQQVKKQYYRKLMLLGEVETLGAADVSRAYDEICDRKKDLDALVIDHYYFGADSLLQVAFETGHKASARLAYRYLQKCRKASGDLHYQDIDDLLVEAIERGTVYFVDQGVSLSESLFRRAIPPNSDIEPDCAVTGSVGFVHTDHSEEVFTRTYQQEVQTGTETYQDTSGATQTRSVFTDVEASVTTTIHYLSASQTASVEVVRLTEHCNISSDREEFVVREELEEVEIEGDQRALPYGIEEASVNIHWVLSDLQRDVQEDARSWLQRY